MDTVMQNQKLNISS